MIWIFGKKSFFLLCICLMIDHCSSLERDVCPPRVSSESMLESIEENTLFYVDADHGSDEWNGLRLEPNNGGKSGPFRTIPGAIKGMRRLRRKSAKPATLYVRKGIHYVNERVVLSRKDSNLKIVGYPGDERPIISGAVRIPGSHFQQYDDKVWAAPFHGSCSKHVFLGTKRLVRSRKPNLESWNGNELTGKGPYLTIKDLLDSNSKCNRAGRGGFKQRCSNKNKYGFVFHDGDINPGWASPEGGSTADILVFHAWTAERGHISHIIDNKVYFQSPLRKAVGTSPKPSGWRYIVENVRSELDNVGEFYCNDKKKLLFVIPPKRAFDTEDVYISQSNTIFYGVKAENLKWIDIEFRHTHDKNFEGYNPRPALLDFRECNGIQIYRCSFINVGFNAIYFSSSINSEVKENKFYDIGNYAVITKFFGNVESKFATRNITIDKNTMRGCGVTILLQSACIFVQGLGDIKVTRNDVSVTPYAGIRAGWQKTFTRDFLRDDEYVFVITENNVHDFGMGILNDFAGIYLSSNRICGSAKRDLSQCHLPSFIGYNTIHHSNGYWYGGIGVYGDTGVSSLLVTKNWIYDLADCAINFHCGQYNEAINNMIYHTNRQRVFGTCKSIGPGSIPKQIVAFKRNIIYIADENARMYSRGDYWNNDVPAVNQNVYFFNPRNEATEKVFFPKYLSWEEWRTKTLNDGDSIIENPLFINTGTKDFRLNRISPAFSVGIRCIDLRDIQTGNGICQDREDFTSLFY